MMKVIDEQFPLTCTCLAKATGVTAESHNYYMCSVTNANLMPVCYDGMFNWHFVCLRTETFVIDKSPYFQLRPSQFGSMIEVSFQPQLLFFTDTNPTSIAS